MVSLSMRGEIVRGTTRSLDPLGNGSGTEGWHVYTATFGHCSSVYVDGVCEGTASFADLLPQPTASGLTIGSDVNHTYPLTGAIAQVRVFEGQLPNAHRELIEKSLAQRYGLEHSSARHAGPSAKRQRRK